MQNHNSRCFDVILIRFVSHEFRQDSKTLIEVRMPCVSKKTKERSITSKLDTNGVGLLEITNTLSITYRSFNLVAKSRALQRTSMRIQR